MRPTISCDADFGPAYPLNLRMPQNNHRPVSDGDGSWKKGEKGWESARRAGGRHFWAQFNDERAHRPDS